MATTFTRVYVKKADKKDVQEAVPPVPLVRVNESVSTKFNLASNGKGVDDCEIHEFSNQSGMELWKLMTSEGNGFSPTVPMDKTHIQK